MLGETSCDASGSYLVFHHCGSIACDFYDDIHAVTAYLYFGGGVCGPEDSTNVMLHVYVCVFVRLRACMCGCHGYALMMM